MRKYINIYKDYCNWVVEKSDNPDFKYEYILREYGETTTHAILYKSILELIYDPKDGLYYFCKFIVGNLMDIGYPNPFRYNNLLRRWDKLIKSHKKLAFLCARGHGKSVFFSEIVNIYDMFLFKHRRVILISASQEQANRILKEIKDIIDNNEWLASKKEGNRWAIETIGYNKGYILVKGIGSEILGEHVDRIVIDDILRSDNKLSDMQIEDYIDMTLDPMLTNRNGQMVLVGTPKTESDIFTAIKNRIRDTPNTPWKVHEYPAILNYEKKVLQCPDRFSWEQIMDKRLSMGPLKFAREFQLEFFSRDKSLFPKSIIDPAKEKGKDYTLLNKADIRGSNWLFVFGVDVARSGSVSADYSVAVGLAFDCVKNTKQLVHFWRSKGLKISEQAKQLAEVSRKFNNPMFLVEQNNMGQDMIDELAENNVFVESMITGGATSGRSVKKEELIRFLITAFEHEQIIIPRGDVESREEMNILEDELARFCTMVTPAGFEQFKGMGSHDDCVMALALANRATQSVGIPFAVSSYRNGQLTEQTPYGTLIRKDSDKETDLVRMIKMGIIK